MGSFVRDTDGTVRPNLEDPAMRERERLKNEASAVQVKADGSGGTDES